jgi:hypothetical protein
MNRLDDLELARRSFTGDRQGAVSATGERIPVELRSIHASTNREIGEDLAVVAVHDDELLRLPAADEEAMKPFHRRELQR